MLKILSLSTSPRYSTVSSPPAGAMPGGPRWQSAKRDAGKCSVGLRLITCGCHEAPVVVALGVDELDVDVVELAVLDGVSQALEAGWTGGCGCNQPL
eukprot:2292922-Heterocapsa_arctica.AAC.1